MKVLGIVLVLLGSLALGFYAFRYLGGTPAGGEAAAGWASPVVAGIVVVGGLLILAGTGRRE
ncbi:MAG: hypothetical protein K2X82_10825 [Gemmataceae bacterium]|nr:hypothetical protein [Gemmataceae bacterium]